MRPAAVIALATAASALALPALAQPSFVDVVRDARGHEQRTAGVDSNGHLYVTGGGFLNPPTDEMDDATRESIRAVLRENREVLRAAGKLRAERTKTITNFAWPLRNAAGRTDFGHHGISNFIDENPAYPNQLLDYACGTRTYDLASGYNHKGTDIFNWPFSWKKMDDEDVVIAAGAPGTILSKSDGNYDRNCAMGSGTWNAVYVEHADGSVAWYGHMKNGSATVKGVGETVVVGEYLGIVGSSGSSTGPHLHLELYDASDNLVDPWLGACNSKSKQVTWAQQRPYTDSAVNALTVGSAAPNFPACPGAETSFATDYVAPGSTAYFAVYMRDMTTATPISIRILRPDGTVRNAPAAVVGTNGTARYQYWFFSSFPSIAGDWTFEATFAGQTYTKTFRTGAAPFGAPQTLAVLSGSAQTATAGAAFAAPLRILVTDAGAQPVKGAKVVFTAPVSGATAVLESRTALTDASGIASVAAIANATVGAYNVNASVAGAGNVATIALQNVSPNADLAITQSVNADPATVGKDVVFTMTASNLGALTATGANVSASYDPAASVIWVSPTCVKQGVFAIYACPAGNLAPGASAQFQLVLRRASAGSVFNNVTTSSVAVDSNPGNNASNRTVNVVAGLPAAQVLRYRLFSPVTLEHHFTTDLNEYNVLGTLVGTWVQEGTVGKVLDNPGAFGGVTAVPYYRLYDTSTRWHHWTTDANEYYTLAMYPWWNAEGVDGYILPTPTAGATQLYRLNYPFLGSLHHWTIDANEYTTLIASFGWIGEGGSGFVIE